MSSLKTVAVTFLHNPQLYHYLTDLDLKVDDYAIVDSPRDGFVVVQVQSITNVKSVKATKFIVQKVDDTNYKKLVDREKQKEAIKLKLEQKKKQMEENYIYERMAESDSEAAELLKMLKELQ